MESYRHYKGGLYTVLCIATHSETNEKLVVYKGCEGKVYARPYDMFFGKVEINGELIHRFAKLKEGLS